MNPRPSSSRDWLGKLKQVLPGRDAAFWAEMDEQLGAQLEEETGEPRSTFSLVASVGPLSAPLGADATGSLALFLLNLDIVYDVQIRWTDEADGHRRFEWIVSPFEDIRADLQARRAIRIPDGLPFKVEIKNPVWPHVTLSFRSGKDLAASDLESAVHRFVNTWGEAAGRGVFHTAGPLRRVGDETFSLTFDFGSAGVDALNALFELLARRDDIGGVVLDS